MGQTEKLTAEQRELLRLLKYALNGKENRRPVKNPQALVTLSEKHKVLPLLYEALEAEQEKGTLPPDVWRQVEDTAVKSALQFYRLLLLSRFLMQTLEKNGIEAALLKGVGTAMLYPVPEMRKSGDVDLLVSPSKLEEAVRCLKKEGLSVTEEQRALHHVAMITPQGIEVELHSLLCEPLDNEKANTYLENRVDRALAHRRTQTVSGVEITMLDEPYHAFQLLLHMLQHYLRSGFGLKLVCDWAVFWNREISPKDRRRYLTLVQGAGLKGFSDKLTQCCVTYLGLSEKKVAWMALKTETSAEAFMLEVLKAEEFGKSAKDRMVSLRGSGILDYVREFHHQMRLNHPVQSKKVWLWPVLWTHTLVRFLINNHTVRHVSLREILKKAGSRGKLTQELHLFETQKKEAGVTAAHSPETVLKNGLKVIIKVQGYSMYPLLVPGVDEVTLAPVRGQRLRKGDLVLYRRKSGILVLHRICRIDEKGYYMVGDHQKEIEGPLPGKQIIGKSEKISKKHFSFSVRHPIYRIYVTLWLWLRPVRPQILWFLAKLNTIWKMAKNFAKKTQK